MRLVWLVGTFALTLPVVAQQRGMYGGVSTGQMVGAPSDPGFAGRLGATVSGLPQTTSSIPINGGIYGNTLPNHGNPGFGSRRGNTLIVPYGVPMVYSGFGGGYGYGSYGNNYDYAPPRALVQPVEPSPSVIINQYFTPDTVRPQLREYTDLPEPIRAPQTSKPRVAPEQSREPQAAAPSRFEQQASDKPTVTLLAFKDSSIAAVIAYWAQNDELHYITKAFKKNVVALSGLDKATTEQLNKERNVEFTLD